MRVESAYPAPILGVSTFAPRNRPPGYADKQVNFRSDPLAKLTRRPPSNWRAALIPSEDGKVKNHKYARRGKQYRILIEADGTVHGFVDDVAKPVTGNLAGYMNTPRKITMNTINDTTFVINTEKVVQMDPATDESTIEKVAHINVTSALNYLETVKITVTDKTTGDTATVSYTAPDVGASQADEKRSTSYVAQQLQTSLDALTAPAVTALVKGSNIAVWHSTDASRWLTVEVETGQGDRSVVCTNQVAQKTDAVTLYAVHGTRITVKPDPTSDKGIYYLQATAVDPDAVIAPTPGDRELQEVVWVESRSPSEPFRFAEDTMPHTVVYDYVTDSFKVGVPELGWTDRETGDDTSCPPPGFVGSPLTTVGYFQQRLCHVANNEIYMTRTDDIFNWWKASATSLLVTDPVSIASSAVGSDVLAHITPHNRDLLITAANGQYKIDGSIAVTPQTVAMPLTTAYECQVSVPPISLGNAVYFPINYGKSTGINEYTGEENTQQDHALAVTKHVVGYMKGTCEHLVGNSNLEMIAVRTSGTSVNHLYVYEQFTSRDGTRRQEAWSQWTFPDTGEVIDLEFSNDQLTMIVHENGYIVKKDIQMYTDTTVQDHDIYLDDMLVLDSPDGKTATLPSEYESTGIIAVQGTGCDYEMFLAPFTKSGNVLTFNFGLSGGNPCKVYVGKRMSSEYRPTRPFVRDDKGIVVESDRLRVAKYTLSVVDTAEVSMRIISDYYSLPDQRYNSRLLNHAANKVGEQPLTTGDVKFSFGMDPDHAAAEFYTNGYMGLTIAGLQWEGQYKQTSKHI